MQISPYTSAYSYSYYNYNQTKLPNKTTSFKCLTTQELSYLNRLEKFIINKYKLVSEDINIISPNGTAVKGCAFVKDNLNHKEPWKNFIKLIITDKDYMALGEINAYHFQMKKNIDILSCSIRNFTNKYNLTGDFMEPEFEAHNNTEGKYKKVGIGLYDNLINYIKENYPQYKTLYASIRSQESWNFHTKYGFTMDFNGTKHPAFDDYDTYCPSSNFLFYNLKK